MMYSGVIALSALSALFAATVSAIPMHGAHHPHHKRDIVWVTETNIDTVTVPVIKTVWVDGDNQVKYNNHHHATTVSSSTAVVAAYSTPSETPAAASTPVSSAETSETSAAAVPATTSTAPAYVAPTSTSVYVAPTTSSTSEYVAPTISSTSVYVAPVTTSTPEALPTTSDTYVAPTTTSAEAAPTATSSGGDNGGYNTVAGAANTGDLTWFQTGLGACGVTNSASDSIVAISEAVFDAYSTGNPNTNPLCGRQVSITGADGSQHKATVVDRCTGCAAADLDLSEDFFNTVTSNGNGRVSNMKWTWA